MKLIDFLVPRFPLKDLPVILAFSSLGAIIAGVYGIFHDHVTFAIGPEYFTRFKFEQFRWADLRLGNWMFVSCIGFLATWWVGMIIGWILARRTVPGISRPVACRKILYGFAIVFGTTLLFGILGYLYGLYRGPQGDYSAWQPALDNLGVSDRWSFMRVAYIHNAGYLGGLTGLILACLLIRSSSKIKSLSQRATP